MRAISMSRTAAMFLVLALAGACSDDPTGPSLDPGVGRGSPASMTLVPLGATIAPGESIRLDARLLDQAGRAMSGVEISWRSSDNAVAVVSAAGEVFGHRPGRALITASARGKSQTSTIQVQFQGPKPPPEPDPNQSPNVDKGPVR
jgi:Bacterial Ig-like domain (group 2)